MANREKSDLILHPDRLQILDALSEGPHSTQELSQMLPGITQPTLYRHIKKLLDGGMIEVTDTRTVRGVQEKIYRLAASIQINAEDVAGMSKDEILRYFISFAATQIQEFADYLTNSPDPLEPVSDRAGYHELTFYASVEEMDRLGKKLNEELLAMAQQGPAKGRRRRKMAFISHPLPQKKGE